MGKLDINSEKGRKTVEQENKMLRFIEKCWGVTAVVTKKKDDHADAVCDGFLIKDGEVIALFEDKCRKMTMEQLKKYNSWLITHEKIKKCRLLSEYLRIPFIGFLYLLDDDIIMHWNITDSDGRYLFEFTHEETSTRRTINDDTQTIRDNAYLPLSAGKIVQSRKIK
jgi:hypothetical protein